MSQPRRHDLLIIDLETSDRTPGTLMINRDRQIAQQAKLILDETELVDKGSIGDDQIALIQQRAQMNQREDIVRMCAAAVSGFGEMRTIARAGCAELWNDDVEASAQVARALSQETTHDLKASDRIAYDALISATGDRSSRMFADEPTASRPLSLQLLEFQCPICHKPILAEDVRGVIRVPWHRMDPPVFPFGYAGPMCRVECPASLMEVSQMCDGDHMAPACDDPQCWLSHPSHPAQTDREVEPEPEPAPAPRPERDLEDDDEPVTRVGYAAIPTRGAAPAPAQNWDEHQGASQTSAYDVQLRRMPGARG